MVDGTPPRAGQGAGDRLLRFILAAAGGPLPVDDLAGTGLWRTSTLWAAAEAARGEGLVEADGPGGPLRWRDEARRDAAIAGPSDEEVASLLARPGMPDLVLAGARAAAGQRRFASAERLYRAVLAAPDRAALRGGEATWVGAVVEATRLLRSSGAVPGEVLDAAVASAESRGDLGAQAVLLAARGLQWLGRDPARARQLFGRAAEAAEALGAPAVCAEVRAYVAVALVLAGRLGEGVEAFEALQGDVPGDPLDPAHGPPLDLDGASPAAALAMLALAYAGTGDLPRAVDLLQRLVAKGRELAHPALEAQGRVVLAVVQVMAGDDAAATPHAEAAHAALAQATTPYAWAAAVALACVRAASGRLSEARGLLEGALPTWRRAGRPWIGGSRFLRLLEDLASSGLPPLEGLDVESEVERHLAVPQPWFAGMAHRWRAARLAGGKEAGAVGSAGARHHLAEAVRLLREAGAVPELRLALADAERLDGVGGPARPGSEPIGAVEAARLAGAILDLGRLGRPGARPGPWGEVAARLGRELGAERCAVVERGAGGLILLAARGAPAWQEALLSRLRERPPAAPVFEGALAGGGPGAGAGQLVLVPFGDGESGRRGVVAFENRDTPPRLGPAHAPLVEALGRQVGILVANLSLWRELSEAQQRLEQENRYHREAAPAAPLAGGRIVGGSPAMREVLELVRRVAPAPTPVLVTGETGVGKELVAREVHHLSPRRDGPLIAVHVAALSPGLVASALFGHERGAFTGASEQARGRFELAHGGTLFLDEVGELSAHDQVRLLRVLQEGTFERVGGTRPLRSDFRLVAATNRDLAAEVRAGRFREDLYFRLAAFPIQVPPLRERREEIPTLALYFMERVARKLGLAFEGIGEVDMARLVAHAWPGNVRELQHVVERGALLSDPPRLRVPPLDAAGMGRGPGPGPGARGGPASGAGEELVTLEEAERRHVRRVLHHVGGRVSGRGGAAEVLGLKPSTLQFWIGRLGLRDELARAREARRAR